MSDKRHEARIGDPMVWPVMIGDPPRELATLTLIDSDDPAIDGADKVYELSMLGEPNTPPELAKLEGWSWTRVDAALRTISEKLAGEYVDPGDVADRADVRTGYVVRYAPSMAWEAFTDAGKLLGFANTKEEAVVLVKSLAPLAGHPKFKVQDYRIETS